MKHKKKQSEIDKEISEALTCLEDVDPATDEYKKTCESIERLLKVKVMAEEAKSKRRVSPDTIALIVANLLGIALILGWEQGHIVATKAFSMIAKLRL